MRRYLIALACLSLVLTGCKAKEMLDKADISKELKDKGTTELLNEAAKDEYNPPADGRLTDSQVQMYLKVREHEKKIAQVAKDELKQHAEKADKSGEKSLAGLMEGFKAMGSVADVLTADIRAAKELGYNSAEYSWIKEKVLEASGSAVGQKMAQAMNAQFEKAYAEAKKAHDAATDEQTKAMYAQMLSGYEEQKKQMTAQADEDPAVAHNRQVLSKYETALKAWAVEMSKFQDNGTDVQKSVEDWEKDVNKQIDDAKQQ